MVALFIPPPFGASIASYSFVDSATSTSANITVPATAQRGDIAVLFDYDGDSGNGATGAIPSGYTQLGSDYTDGFNRILQVSAGVLSGGGGTVTGMSASNVRKVMLVFRPDIPANGVSGIGWAGTIVATDPSAIVVPGASYTPPQIVLAVAAQNGSSAMVFTSGTFDGTVANSSGSFRMIVGYQIQNTSAADNTVDMADLGTGNGLAAGLLRA